MQEKFDAIVLRSRNYSDTSLIVKCYTKQKGIVSFIAKGAKKKKNSIMGLFQPLSLVEIVSFARNENVELKGLKEVKSNGAYSTLQFDPVKSGLSIFIAELLDLSLFEEESNPLLYEFLISSFHYLDDLENYANFHIAFLIELSKYLGFYPHYRADKKLFFDLEQGTFHNNNTNTPYISKGDNVDKLIEFLENNFVDTPSIQLNKYQRGKLLRYVLDYYKLHISNFKEPKSLDILTILYN